MHGGESLLYPRRRATAPAPEAEAEPTPDAQTPASERTRAAQQLFSLREPLAMNAGQAARPSIARLLRANPVELAQLCQDPASCAALLSDTCKAYWREPDHGQQFKLMKLARAIFETQVEDPDLGGISRKSVERFVEQLEQSELELGQWRALAARHTQVSHLAAELAIPLELARDAWLDRLALALREDASTDGFKAEHCADAISKQLRERQDPGAKLAELAAQTSEEIRHNATNRIDGQAEKLALALARDACPYGLPPKEAAGILCQVPAHWDDATSELSPALKALGVGNGVLEKINQSWHAALGSDARTLLCPGSELAGELEQLAYGRRPWHKHLDDLSDSPAPAARGQREHEIKFEETLPRLLRHTAACTGLSERQVARSLASALRGAELWRTRAERSYRASGADPDEARESAERSLRLEIEVACRELARPVEQLGELGDIRPLAVS